MTPESLNLYARAVPFRLLGITMINGRTYDIRHPEMIRVGRRDVVVFIPSESDPDLHDRMFLIGHSVIENVTHLDAPTATAPQGAA